MLNLTELSAGDREAPLTLPIGMGSPLPGATGVTGEKGSKHLSSGLLFFFLIPALELQRHCKDELCVFFLMIKLPSSQLKVLCTSVWVFSLLVTYFLFPASRFLLSSQWPCTAIPLCTSGKAGIMVCDDKVKLSPRPPCVVCSCYLEQSMSNLIQYFFIFSGQQVSLCMNINKILSE